MPVNLLVVVSLNRVKPVVPPFVLSISECIKDPKPDNLHVLLSELERRVNVESLRRRLFGTKFEPQIAKDQINVILSVDREAR